MYGIISMQSTKIKCSNGSHKCKKRPRTPKMSMISSSCIINPHILTMIMYLLFNLTVNHRTRNQISVHLIEKLSHFFITPQSVV
ncbi:hypothetical protein F383_36445 [Gossypium arboreum]|uniref:Uncharacterized protein n=1 Tax=Gossypium arboreum TaxID=29729 RepID=A0A0B0N496_GOSAR|nr:hypothetical protein F383_36445 [Gossypium arboreum]